MVFYGLFSVVIVAAIIVIVAIPVLKIQSLKSRLAFLDLSEKEASKYIETENEFNVVRNMYLQRENEAKRLSKSGVDMLKIIEKLESYLPDRIFIQSMVANKAGDGQVEITIRGIAESEEEIATFSDYISKDEYFSGINIGSVSNMYTAGSKKGDNELKNDGQKDSKSSYSFDAIIYLTAGK